MAKLTLRHDYPRYWEDIRSIQRGLSGHVKAIPTQTGEVSVLYYNNLVLDGGKLTEVEKPDTAPAFRCFADYRGFLSRTASRLGENLRSPLRRHGVTPLSSISSGYDSSAAATIAREAGCRRTVTIKDSTSYWRGSDSGKPVADALGMSCVEYDRTARDYPDEEAVWAASVWPGILNWTRFDYPEPTCLFFTGCHGEKVWDRVDHDHSDPFVRRDVSSLGFCEFRLLRGAWQCPVPFWGVRHSHELKAVTLSEEMRPWYTGLDYDKPIARRLVEEAGVPREAFGVMKKNSVLAAPFYWPYSLSPRRGFSEYLRRHGVFAPSNWLVRLIRHSAQTENLLHRNVLGKLGFRRRFRPWLRTAGPSLLFQWANEELKERYLAGLRERGAEQAFSNEVAR